MLERVYLLAIQGQEAVEGGWFSVNWNNLAAAFPQRHYWDILMNPFIIALGAIILLLGILAKSKGFFMLLIAAYGYSAVYHFTIEKKKAGDVMFDAVTLQAQELGPLVIFFVGILLVTVVLLYLGFVKGD